jgi:hypothetical protein
MAAKLKIEKRGDEIKKIFFSSETTEPISTKLSMTMSSTFSSY